MSRAPQAKPRGLHVVATRSPAAAKPFPFSNASRKGLEEAFASAMQKVWELRGELDEERKRRWWLERDVAFLEKERITAMASYLVLADDWKNARRLADKAICARVGRAVAAKKRAAASAPERVRREDRLKKLLERLHCDEDGLRRSNKELVELLRNEHGIGVRRSKVADLRPK